ncbi:MFS transporter [Aspergillus mulundensis]|uniref:Major facilitator superfamily (MFS) profile domain-containing protein n=1 Tax=Aspergillus mulundensis TaxID=1810919 RepID=A0A3D8RQR6_9EURO|nr:Uncharacterized protein DSM5745_06302 [Aspergillus mulundensis]RDW76310.1 Uncharacterized protein DSM5745_06302 [Aspergillus mulundensis]
MTTADESLAILEVAFYALVVLPAVYCLIMHGRPGLTGWAYLLILCALRLAGNGMFLQAYQDGTLSITAMVLNGIGLSPLLGAGLGVLHEAYVDGPLIHISKATRLPRPERNPDHARSDLGRSGLGSFKCEQPVAAQNRNGTIHGRLGPGVGLGGPVPQQRQAQSAITGRGEDGISSLPETAMRELLRDTAFGKLVRILSGHRLLRYPEECDASIASEYIRTEPGQEKTIVVGWRANDSDDPQNWGFGKKLLASSLVWLLTFAVYIGSAIYSPGIPGVATEFGVSTVASTLGLTLFVLGYGIGVLSCPLIWSPLSELANIGRNPIYILTLFAFLCLNFAVVYAQNFGMLLAFRFLTGFIGSPALATGGASMGDIWSPNTRDYMIVVWGTFAIAAPVLGPMVGGFASSANGWTWTMWQLIWVSAFALVALFFLLPETYGPNILYRRARRLRRITEQPFYCEAELELETITSTEMLFEALVRPFQLCFLEPIVLVMNIYISLVYGILYIWFEAFPIVFQEIHGFNPGESGMSFLGIITGTLVFAIPGYFSWKYFHQSQQKVPTPESQLPPAIVGSICLPVSLFWFGWTGNASVHWVVPIMASALFSVGGCLIFNPIFCYLAHAYPRYAASVLAGNDFMRSSFGAGFPLFAAAMFHKLGVGWACTLLGCLTCLFVPFPIVLYWRGRRLRLASRFARHDI